tara:strand:- start:1877 stop:3610 length:1734 start_codon:yes stop_codon:yes gene_type:complete
MPSDIALNNQNAAGQTGDGVVIGGATYAIATDWGAGGGTGFTATHVQIVKPAWGDNYNSYRVSKVKPLPVQIFDGIQGTTGALIDSATNALKITGGVNINQQLEIAGTRMDGTKRPHVTSIIQVVGPTFGVCGPTAYGAGRINPEHFAPVKVTGSVQGYTGMYPVSITFGGGLEKAKPEIGGPGQIRSLYGGPLAYTGATGYYLTTSNRRTLARHIDTVSVQGMHHGTPVGITGTTGGLRIRKLRYPANGVPSSLETGHASLADGDRVGIIGILGATAVEVTGGVVINSMAAGSSFEIRDLSYGRDSIAVGSIDGTTAAQFKLLGSNNQPIGASGEALMVAIDNGTFSGTVNLSTNVYVRNATGGAETALKVRGVTSEHITVIGPLSGGALEVASPSGLNTRNLASATDQVGLGGDALNKINDIYSKVISIRTNTSIMSDRLTLINSRVSDIEKVIEINHTEGSYGGLTGPNSNPDIPYGRNVYVQESIQPSNLLGYTVTLSNIPRAIGSTKVFAGVNLQADPSNTGNVTISSGSSSADKGYVLEPGDSVFIQIDNLNKIYGSVSGPGRQRLNILGS